MGDLKWRYAIQRGSQFFGAKSYKLLKKLVLDGDLVPLDRVFDFEYGKWSTVGDLGKMRHLFQDSKIKWDTIPPKSALRLPRLTNSERPNRPYRMSEKTANNLRVLEDPDFHKYIKKKKRQAKKAIEEQEWNPFKEGSQAQIDIEAFKNSLKKTREEAKTNWVPFVLWGLAGVLVLMLILLLIRM